MDKKCKECGGELVEGSLAGNYLTGFLPKSEEKKFVSKRSKVVCCCCKSCGLIQDIRAIELDKLK